MVARLDLRVTHYDNTLPVAHQSADGDAFGQPQVFHLVLGYLGTCLYDKLCYVGIGHSEAFHVAYVCVKHHLVDVAGGYHFLVDDGADVQAFCHAYVIYVFHFGNGLPYFHALGGKAGKDVGFRVSGQCHKSVGILDALLYQQVHVAPVPIDNHDLVVQLLSQSVATRQIVVYDFHLHVVRHALGGADGNSATTHNHYALHVHIILFACDFPDVRNVFAGSREINDVVQLDGIIPPGYQGLAASFDGYDVIRQGGVAQLVQRYVQYFGFFTHLGAYQYQGAVAEFPPLAHPAHADGRSDFPGSQHFRID